MIESALNQILQKTFPDASVTVENQSALHAGHAGSPGTGESHFRVMIVDPVFAGQTRVARHRMVTEAVAPLFDKGLHALSMNLKTPDEV